MFVLEKVDDTIWLEARAYNRCAPDGIPQRYWFVCSFYGIDEFGPSTGSGASQAAFVVTPNPNNGSMTLDFEHLTGKIDIKLYDMRGVLVDQLQTYGATERHTLPYQCPAIAKGIYCFVVSGKEGTLTKKIIVQ